MTPTFKHGDVILVNRIAYILRSPKIHDVVVVKDPRNGKEILKRIVKIKDDTYFIEGDNKRESTDSRNFGPVKKNAIAGLFMRKV